MSLDAAIARVRERTAALAPEMKSGGPVEMGDVLAGLRQSAVAIDKMIVDYVAAANAYIELWNEFAQSPSDETSVDRTREIRAEIAAMRPALAGYADAYAEMMVMMEQAAEAARDAITAIEDGLRDRAFRLEVDVNPDITAADVDIDEALQVIDEWLSEPSGPEGAAT